MMNRHSILSRRRKSSPALLLFLLLSSPYSNLFAADQDGDSIPDEFDNCVQISNQHQLDSDGDGFGNGCDPDFNNDGTVTLQDLPPLKLNFFDNAVPFELSENATLNFEDLAKFKVLLNQAPGPSATFQGIAYGFQTISNSTWDTTAIRRVLHTFAYGGQASEEQIQAWADLTPEQAIISMLNFSESNLGLSPPSKVDTGKLWETGGSLNALGDFWSSDAESNDTSDDQRHLG